MTKAVLFGQVEGKYRVVVIDDAANILSKKHHERGKAAQPLFGTGWRNYYTGPQVGTYAHIVEIARRFQEENGGEIPIYQIELRGGMVTAALLE